jgi:hypothetical protein
MGVQYQTKFYHNEHNGPYFPYPFHNCSSRIKFSSDIKKEIPLGDRQKLIRGVG